MNRTYKSSPSSVLKLLTVAMLSMFLVACSSGGTDDGTDLGTLDGGDGFDGDDDFGLGDNEFDEFEEFEEDPNTTVGAACSGRIGSDVDSSDFFWDNNCTMGIDTDNSDPFYYSTYAEGIQRVLYCSGVAGTTGITAFADGFFGPGTANAVRSFQESENAEVIANLDAGILESRTILDVDGIVGPQTWGRLQSKVELYEENNAYIETDGNIEVFGVLPSTYSAGIADCTSNRNFHGVLGTEFTEIQSWLITDVPDGAQSKTFGGLVTP